MLRSRLAKARLVAFSAAFFAASLLISLSAAAASVTLAWDPSPDTTVVGYKIHYGPASASYTTQATFGNVTQAAIDGLTAGVTYYFAATAYNADGLESDFSNEISYTPPTVQVNAAPTLDLVADQGLQLGTGQKTVQLTGIGSGSASENQTLTVQAVSSNPSVVATPSVLYTSPQSTATLVLTPLASGSATITVTVSDGQQVNSTVTRSFTVTVTAANIPPTIAQIPYITIPENSGPQTVQLSGISCGAAYENQPVTVTAYSANPDIIPHPSVLYVSPSTTGTLTFQPYPGKSGSAVLVVTVSDGQLYGGSISLPFLVTIKAGNQPPTIDAIPNVALAENSSTYALTFTGVGPGAPSEQQVLRITATSSNPSLIPVPVVEYTSPNPSGRLLITPVQGQFGNATITVTVNDGQPENSSNSRSFVVTVGAANRPPTLNPIADVIVPENSASTTVSLTGITTGADHEIQPLTVSAVSSDPALVPNPTVAYTSPNAQGSLRLTPVAGKFGTATVTVTVSDGQTSDSVVSRSFKYTVVAANRPPTIAPIANASILENAGPQNVLLTGISSGAEHENQVLRVTAVSSNPGLIPHPAIQYATPNASGLLTFTPVQYGNGTATITVTVDDGQPIANTASQTFTVVVNPVNQPPTLGSLANLVLPQGSGAQIVSLTGIGSGAPNEQQNLVVTATSSNPSVVPAPYVNYASPNSTGTLTLTPTGTGGNAVITVTVNDGDENGVTSRTFTVSIGSVNRPPTIDDIPDMVVYEGSGTKTVQLTGISAGASYENQVLMVSAYSSNPSVIPNPGLTYVNPDSTAILRFTPVPGALGSATITVILNDGQATDNTAFRTFKIEVVSGNRAPTLDPISDLSIAENSSMHSLPLSGITSGSPQESQPLTVVASSSNPELLPHPKVSYASPGASGTLSLSPVPFAFGTAVVTVTVSDGQTNNSTITRIFQVTVTPVNQPPTLSPIDNIAISENASLQKIVLQGISSGAPNEEQELVVRAVSSNPGLIPDPTVSYSSPAATGELSFMPVAGNFGSATITVTVNDGSSSDSTVSRTFTITVGAVNRPPTLGPIADRSIQENAGAQTVQLNGIGAGATHETQNLAVTAVSSNPGLIPNPRVTYTSPDSAGLLTFTPVQGAFGSAVVTVTVNDGQPTDSTFQRSFTVTVVPVNRPPTLDAIADISLPENTVSYSLALGGISAGASHELQQLSVTAVSSDPALIPHPQVGYISPNNAGVLTLRPATYGNGTAVITVTVSDGQSANSTISRSFQVTLTPVNQPPTLAPIANIAISENAGEQVVALSGISSGAPNEEQTLVVTASSSNPSLIPDPAVAYTTPTDRGTLSFTPVPGAFGSATITVAVNDGGSADNLVTRSFVVSVGPVNRPPTLNPIADISLNENTAAYVVPLTGIGPGASHEVQVLKITAVSSQPDILPNPTVTYTSPEQSGSLTLRPLANKFGKVNVTVTISDGQTTDSTVSRVVQVTINPVNRAPTLDAVANVTVLENAPLQNIALSGITAGAEHESQPLTVMASSSNPDLIPNPKVSYTSPNTTALLSFTPAPFEFGTAQITVTVNDAQAANSTFTRVFTVTVTPVNQPPTLNAIPDITMVEGTRVYVVSLSGIGSGANNESQPLTVTATSSNPTLIPKPVVSYTSPGATATLSLNPATNGFGTSTVTITVNDGQATNATVTRSFLVTVTPVNRAPTMNPVSDIVLQENSSGTSVAITGLTSGAAHESQPLQVTAVSSNPELVPHPRVTYVSPNPTATLTLAPVAYGFGVVTITVTVSDGQAVNSTFSQTFRLTINPVNQAPTLAPIDNIAISENSGTHTVQLAGISTGAANENDTLRVTAVSSNPALIPNPTVAYSSPASTGQLSFAPVTGAFGSATISVTVDDGQPVDSRITRTFVVTVGPVNRPPTLNPLADMLMNENASATMVALSGISAGASHENQALTVTARSSDPTIVPHPQVIYSSPSTIGTLSVRPANNVFGKVSITVTVDDGQNLDSSFTRTFNITVVPANRPPTLQPLSDLTVDENAPLQTVALTGIGPGASHETQTLNVLAISSNPGLIPNPTVTYSSPSATGSLSFKPVAFEFGTAIITVTVDDGQTSANTVVRSFAVKVTPVNQPPTVDPIADVTVNENSPPVEIGFTGVTFGPANEYDSLTVTARSSNPALIPHPVVVYTEASSAGTLTLAPAPTASGTAVITLTLDDGNAINGTTARTFTVNVLPGKKTPTLDALSDLSIDESTGPQWVQLSGITPGTGNTSQALTVSAMSSNPGLIPNPSVTYMSPGQSGQLTFTPVPYHHGIAIITVRVSDSQEVNSFVTRSFRVTVREVNQRPTLNPIANLVIDENSQPQVLELSGISSGAPNEFQFLQVTASSSDPSIISHPQVSYASPGSVATMTVQPVQYAHGTAFVTVRVNDNQASNNIMTRSFSVTVMPVNQPPTLTQPANVTLAVNASPVTLTLSGISSGAPNEQQTLKVTAVSGNTNVVKHPTVTYTSPGITAQLRLSVVSNAIGLAPITVTVEDGQASNNIVSKTFMVGVGGEGYTLTTNQAPTIDSIPNVTLRENDPERVLNLTGITSGAQSEVQPLTVMASSSNPNILPHPVVRYTSPQSTAELVLKPNADAFGSVIVTVTVGDGQLTNSITRKTFLVSVTAVNQPPTLNPLGNLALPLSAPAQSIPLTGISAGPANELQSLTVTATSSNPQVIPQPTVTYRSGNSMGTLSFAPIPGASGTSTISVTVSDGQPLDSTITRKFIVNVGVAKMPPTLDPISDVELPVDAGTQSILLTGISPGSAPAQSLQLRAVSSSASLIAAATVNYTPNESTALLTFTPAAGQSGMTTMRIIADNGQSTSNIFEQAFTITVKPAQMKLALGSTTVLAGQSSSVPLDFSTSLGVTNLTITIEVAPDKIEAPLVTDLAPELDPAQTSVTVQSGNSILVKLSAKRGQQIRGTHALGRFGFRAVAGQQTSIVPLRFRQTPVVLASSGAYNGVEFEAGRVVIVGQQALLESVPGSNTSPKFLLHGKPGSSYAVEYTTNLVTWTQLPGRIPMDQTELALPGLSPAPAKVFYRAVEFMADPPVVEARLDASSGRVLTIYGRPGASYTIEYCTTSGPNRVWYPLASVTLETSFKHQVVPDLGGFSLFRLRKN